jgi:prophage antirepressor-like protein
MYAVTKKPAFAQCETRWTGNLREPYFVASDCERFLELTQPKAKQTVQVCPVKAGYYLGLHLWLLMLGLQQVAKRQMCQL